eukprot:TRINITY_DN5637_c0_g1_i1.p1 TRINITY_DN5637_c0_g1~~TRINITY_DN5637_c0_g1_i1.p1  ORF type:complete len:296 (+),score=65.91 TRINITY_DN5637_c0_g1_i1:49-936(+)
MEYTQQQPQDALRNQYSNSETDDRAQSVTSSDTTPHIQATPSQPRPSIQTTPLLQPNDDIEMNEHPTIAIPHGKRRFCQRTAVMLQLAWAPNSVLQSLQTREHRFPRVTLAALEALLLMPPIEDESMLNPSTTAQATQETNTLHRSPSYPNFHIQSSGSAVDLASMQSSEENDTQAHSPYVASMLRHAMYQIADYDLLPDILVCAACVYVRRAYASDRSLRVSGSLLLRRFLAATAVAAKMWQDEPFNLATFAILGSIPVAELGAQEMELIAILRGKLTLERDLVLSIHRILTSD